MSELAPPHRSSRAASAALVAPLIVTLCLSAYVVAGWASGGEPFWAAPDLTLSEAVVVRDVAEAVRLIRAGHDPNRAWTIRADLSDRRELEMATPLEAAIRIRRLEIVLVLISEGARLTTEGRPKLVELARLVDAPDIADYLATPR